MYESAAAADALGAGACGALADGAGSGGRRQLSGPRGHLRRARPVSARTGARGPNSMNVSARERVRGSEWVERE